MDIVLGSVVYSQALNYIDDFLESLKNQTVQDFDIILVSDDIEKNVWNNRFACYIDFFGSRLNVFRKNRFSTEPYQLRIEMIKEAKKNNYELLVMCDCDDKCADNRIEEIKNVYKLEPYLFFYNEIVSFDNEKIMPSMPDITDSIEQIQEENYLGLTNTALALYKISDEFIESLSEGNTNIFDWYLFSRIVLKGGIGKKIENTKTYYRIYQNNLAGVSSAATHQLIKELAVKQQHYRLLRKYHSVFENLIRKYDELDLGTYLLRDKAYSFWWGQLK